MKVQMKEYYQDAYITLTPDVVYDVDDTLGFWLLEHRKAERVAPQTFEEFVTPDVHENVTNVKTEVVEDLHPVDEPIEDVTYGKTIDAPIEDVISTETLQPKAKGKRGKK